MVGRFDLTQRLRAKAQGGGNKAREVWGPPWMGGGQGEGDGLESQEQPC